MLLDICALTVTIIAYNMFAIILRTSWLCAFSLIFCLSWRAYSGLWKSACTKTWTLVYTMPRCLVSCLLCDTGTLSLEHDQHVLDIGKEVLTTSKCKSENNIKGQSVQTWSKGNSYLLMITWSLRKRTSAFFSTGCPSMFFALSDKFHQPTVLHFLAKGWHWTGNQTLTLIKSRNRSSTKGINS